MDPTPVEHLVEGVLSGVTERGVPDVVTQADGLGQGLVQAERNRHRASDLGDLERVGEPGDEMVVAGVDEHLGLASQPPEGVGVDDAVAVPFECGTERVGLLRTLPALGLGSLGGGGCHPQEFGVLSSLAGNVPEGFRMDDHAPTIARPSRLPARAG